MAATPARWLALLVVVVCLTSLTEAQVAQDASAAFSRLRAFNDVFKDPATVDLDLVRRTLKSAIADPDESLRYAYLPPRRRFNSV